MSIKMKGKLLFVLLLLFPIASFGHSDHDIELAKEETAELLRIFKDHLIEQLNQTNEWLGDDALTSLSLYNQLIETTESKEQPIERTRKLLVFAIGLIVEDVEKLCSVKSYEASKERCYKILGEAHRNLTKYQE